MHYCFTVFRFSPLLIKKKWSVIPVVRNHFSIIIRIIFAKFDRNWSGDVRKKSKMLKVYRRINIPKDNKLSSENVHLKWAKNHRNLQTLIQEKDLTLNLYIFGEKISFFCFDTSLSWFFFRAKSIKL